MLYRLLAQYKIRARDPELKRATNLAFVFFAASAILSTLQRYPGGPVPVFSTARGLAFAAAILFFLPLAISFWEANLRDSRLAFAGVIAFVLAVPIFVLEFVHQWFGVALPTGGLFLALALPGAGGVIVGLLLIAAALFSNRSEN